MTQPPSLEHFKDDAAAITHSSEQEADQLRLLLMALGNKANESGYQNEPKDITLTPAQVNILLQLINPITQRDIAAVWIGPAKLTVQQAADYLGVSQQSVYDSIKSGKIKAARVQRHSKIDSEDLRSYKAERDLKRAAAMNALAMIDSSFL